MPKRYLRWCPNGCGKSVVCIRTGNDRGYNYYCPRCRKIFKKRDLE